MDHWQLNPEDLHGRSKETMGHYVAGNGFFVPQIFGDLEEAREEREKSHFGILLRSEFMDYEWIPGVFDTFRLGGKTFIETGEFCPRNQSLDDLTEQYLNLKCTPLFSESLRRWTDVTEQQVRSGFSFSVWKRIPGHNRLILADSSIKGRYHIFTRNTSMHKDPLPNYTIWESGIAASYGPPLDKKLKGGLSRLVGTYESIMHLPNHISISGEIDCSMMEFQTYRNCDYFVQKFITRPFSNPQFQIEHAPPGYERCLWVRGHTPPEGMECRVILVYAKDKQGFPVQEEEADGIAHTSSINSIFEKARLKKDKIHLLPWRTHDIMPQYWSHALSAGLFLPALTIIFPDILSDNEMPDAYARAGRGKNTIADYHVISDGRQAYIKRV